jgi:hypothetical protein
VSIDDPHRRAIAANEEGVQGVQGVRGATSQNPGARRRWVTQRQ